MPIVIKELFPSDPISEALEKINFNFDQLLLAGGGPPGPQGAIGPQGIPGPQGQRGDHWQAGGASGIGFTGPTSDHGPVYGSLQDTDHWLDNNGDVWEWQAGATNAWVFTGTNLKGPTGPGGSTGGSFEFQLYLGASGNLIDGANNGWYPEQGPVSIGLDNANANFFIPSKIYKNNLFLGDRDWAYQSLKNLSNFNGISNGVYQTKSPKLMVVQNSIDGTGFGGLQLGAYGLTGSTGTIGTTAFYGGSTGATSDARDMFSAGYALRVYDGAFSHVFRARTNTIDFEIQAGDIDPNINNGKSPEFRITSDTIRLRDFSGQSLNADAKRSIDMYRRAIGSSYIDPNFNTQIANVIEFNSVIESNANPAFSNPGFISLQNRQSPNASLIPGSGYAHTLGTVIIGPTSNSAGTLPFGAYQVGSGLNIVRPINQWDTISDSHITLWNTNASSTGDYALRVIGSSTIGSPNTNTAQLISRRLGINGRLSSGSGTRNTYRPLFPLHIRHLFDENATNGTHWAGSPTISLISVLQTGMDIEASSTWRLAPGRTQNTTGPGIGFGLGATTRYADSETAVEWSWSDSVINAYYTGPTAALRSGIDSGYHYQDKVSPPLFMQVGPEGTHGNLGIGFVSQLNANPNLWISAHSKLSVSGSVRIGSTSNSYHNAQTIAPVNGLLIEGSIQRGATSILDLRRTSLISGSGFLNALGSTSYGIASADRTLSRTFIATGPTAQGRTSGYMEPHFSLPDGRSGMTLEGIGDAYLTTNPLGTGSTATTSNQYVRALRFANSRDNTNNTGQGNGWPANGTAGVTGVQHMGVMANDALVIDGMSAGPLFQSSVASSDRDGTYAAGFDFVIPCTKSTVMFIGSGYVNRPFPTPARSVAFWDYWIGRSLPWSVHIQPGFYIGQTLNIVSMGWQSPIVISNNPRLGRRTGAGPFIKLDDPYSDYHCLALESNIPISGSLGGQAIGSIALYGWTLQDAPYPFPYGATAGTNSAATIAGYQASITRSNWTPRGQFTIRDYRSITLQWLPFVNPIQDANGTTGPVVYRWVEISRTINNYRFFEQNSVEPIERDFGGGSGGSGGGGEAPGER
jgi:hypothetical protein